MLNLLSGEYASEDKQIYEELKTQLNNGKNKTWRETMDSVMPNLPKIE
jgi:hypothetical protein